MAATIPVLRPLGGTALRLGIVLFAGAAAGGAILLARAPAAPVELPVSVGKHEERLGFVPGGSEIFTPEARIVDTLAMFGMPQVEPQPWRTASIRDVVADAGGGPMPGSAMADPGRRGSVRLPAHNAEPRSDPVSHHAAASLDAVPPGRGGFELFGWEVPGSRRLPGRGEAVRAAERVGAKASELGRGTAGFVSRASVALGEGLAHTGGAIASVLGWR